MFLEVAPRKPLLGILAAAASAAAAAAFIVAAVADAAAAIVVPANEKACKRKRHAGSQGPPQEAAAARCRQLLVVGVVVAFPTPAAISVIGVGVFVAILIGAQQHRLRTFRAVVHGDNMARLNSGHAASRINELSAAARIGHDKITCASFRSGCCRLKALAMIDQNFSLDRV